MNKTLMISAVWGLISVLMGALSSHAEIFNTVNPESMMTAIRYNMVYAALTTILSLQKECSYLRYSTFLFLVGNILFSGSIYVVAFTGLHMFIYGTPAGGIILMLGWISLFVAGILYNKGKKTKSLPVLKAL